MLMSACHTYLLKWWWWWKWWSPVLRKFSTASKWAFQKKLYFSLTHRFKIGGKSSREAAICGEEEGCQQFQKICMSKMFIYIAESGHTIEVECEETTRIELIQNVLVPYTNIPPSEQMLICGDMRLDPSQSLGIYKLPDDARHVFLYNKSRLVGSDTLVGLVEDLEVVEIVIPKPSVTGQFKHPLEDALDPALKMLPSYEIEFKFHFQKGHALFSASQKRLEICGRLLQEQKVQEMAIGTAQHNMELYYKHIDAVCTEFMKQYMRQHKRHAYLLSNLQHDLTRLRACKLHPALRTRTWQALIHFVDEAHIVKMAEECSYSHEQFGGKVGELRMMYSGLQQSVEALFNAQPPVNLQELEEAFSSHSGLVEEQASIIQTLSKDVSTVKKLVDDAIRENQDSGTFRPHDLVLGLGPMYEVHKNNHLPRLEACDWDLQELQEHCTKSKNAMNLFVHGQLQLVASLQANIRDMRNRLAVFRDALSHQDNIFRDLKLVPRVGPAYKACLAEVVRRKAAVKLYMGQAGQMAEKLARKRDIEVEHREEFLRVQSAYIPSEVLRAMGLFELPSLCVVNIAPFDMKLLDIDVDDLERYAPDSLIGPSQLASGRTSSHRSSATTSTGSSSQGAGAVESEGVQEPDFKEGLLGGEDITGTSNLEVENAWLKSELAAAVAMLCNLDPDFELNDELGADSEFVDGERLKGVNPAAARKTAEALKLKDDHAKHLHEIIVKQEAQCKSYENRIRELEQRLESRQRHVTDCERKDNIAPPEQMLEESITSENTGPQPEELANNRLNLSGGISEPMDEGILSAIATECSVTGATDGEVITREKQEDTNIEDIVGSELGDETTTTSSQGEKPTDANVENKSDPSAMEEARKPDAVMENDQTAESLTASITEPHEVPDASGPANELPQDQELEEAKDEHRSKDAITDDKDLNHTKLLLKETQSVLRNTTQECEILNERLTNVLAEIGHLRADLESNENLLSEAQLNCAHLENRLHEAREEARTNLCAANRRAAEYNALRTSSVRLRGLMERFKVAVAGSPSSFLDSLQTLSVSNSSGGDSSEVEFRKAIQVLAERVGTLVQQRSELLDRCKHAEASQQFLSKELEKMRL